MTKKKQEDAKRAGDREEHTVFKDRAVFWGKGLVYIMMSILLTALFAVALLKWEAIQNLAGF